jgi:hypothetical protein
MSPEKSWFKEFKKNLERSETLSELEIQRKSTTSWSELSFTIPPADAAMQVLSFISSTNHLMLKNIISGAQRHKYIQNLLLEVFSYKFDVFFVLPEP